MYLLTDLDELPMGIGHYAITKTALVALTKILAKRLLH